MAANFLTTFSKHILHSGTVNIQYPNFVDTWAAKKTSNSHQGTILLTRIKLNPA